MGLFGLGGFTEVDPNGRLAVTLNRVTAAALTRNETAYVYRDRGAAFYAGDFLHQVDVRATAYTGDGMAVLWAIADVLSDRANGSWGGGNALDVFAFHYLGAYRLYLEERESAVSYQDYMEISVNATYYLEIERDEAVGTYGTLYCRVYASAADRAAGSGALDTLSLALHAKRDHRYLYALASSNAASGSVNLSGYAENLNLVTDLDSCQASGRGQNAVLDAWAAAGRGQYMSTYAARALGGRGVHAAYGSWPASARGGYALTVAYAASGRGLHAVLQAWPASARGRHLARNSFAATGRGKHARCIAFTAQGQGLHRAANDALAVYELYVGIDGLPDFDAAPFETFTSLPHETAALDPAPAGTERVYHLVLRRRNKHSLATRNVGYWSVTVDDAGAEVRVRPSAPEEISVVPAAAGAVLVTARYMALEDGAYAATTWLVYATDTGVDPDPDLDTPTEVAMVAADGNARLSWTSGAFADGADVRVLVRTRRTDTVDAGPPPVTVDVDSDNVDVHSATADTDGPAQVDPAGVFLGTLHEQVQ